ncbi:type II toxin-antitoxin system RelE/ParE family toxin [archaeon]|nr:type II toxin-antitoxin system RelE/ParE family toxin [archaeon]
MVRVISLDDFKRKFHKIKEGSIKGRIIKQIEKIKANPEIGKPMMYSRKGTRELYVPPFRLSYKIEKNIVYILDLYHKDEQ